MKLLLRNDRACRAPVRGEEWAYTEDKLGSDFGDSEMETTHRGTYVLVLRPTADA